MKLLEDRMSDRWTALTGVNRYTTLYKTDDSNRREID